MDRLTASIWVKQRSSKESIMSSAAPVEPKAYLVGGGIASLAAAVFLIRDGKFAGSSISIFESRETLGGSLDASGSPDTGYIVRGGRMFNTPAYECTYQLLESIGSPTDATASLRDEMQTFTQQHRTHSHSRLVRNRARVDTSSMGFGHRDRLALTELIMMSEASTEGRRIDNYFSPSFFETNFWFMWATMFAFEPWHSLTEFKRYVHRFLHEFHRIDTLAGVDRTRFNQYDSLVEPIAAWLEERGVNLIRGVTVTDLATCSSNASKYVSGITYVSKASSDSIAVSGDDLVFVTNGSMTAASTTGSMISPAPSDARPSSDWLLWETLAAKSPDFGNPHTFNGHIEQSKWMSFTVTLHSPLLFTLMERFTGNTAGTGGLVTFTDSKWLMSVVLPHQPYFQDQPADVWVFWGYALFVDRAGNAVPKPMQDCNGEEILRELLAQLPFDADAPAIIQSATCIPCMMPYITSQFLVRTAGDRPRVLPQGWANLAFVGQFCEIADDVVFTVDYSVRGAQMAVYGLLGIDREIPPIYKGERDPRVLLQSLTTLLK
jgi:oleate hydratase